MEEDIFKLAGGNIPKGIYQNIVISIFKTFDIKKNFARGGVCLTHTCMPCVKFDSCLV